MTQGLKPDETLNSRPVCALPEVQVSDPYICSADKSEGSAKEGAANVLHKY